MYKYDHHILVNTDLKISNMFTTTLVEVGFLPAVSFQTSREQPFIMDMETWVR